MVTENKTDLDQASERMPTIPYKAINDNPFEKFLYNTWLPTTLYSSHEAYSLSKAKTNTSWIMRLYLFSKGASETINSSY